MRRNDSISADRMTLNKPGDSSMTCELAAIHFELPKLNEGQLQDVSKSWLWNARSHGKSVSITLGGVTNAVNPKEDVKQPSQLLGISLEHLSSSSQFLVISASVLFFYLIYGYIQELIFQLKDFKPFGWYLTLVQFAYYGVFGYTELRFKRITERKIPIKTYVLLAFLTVATMGLSNSSLGYLNYPTQVIFKCCKLIPVLIGGILIQGKKYTWIDWVACLCMSTGLIFFTLADSAVQPSFSVYGVILISLALCADAIIGNVQEKTMRQHSASNTEVVFYSYGIGFFYILVGQLLSGQFVAAFKICLLYPLETYGYAFVFSLSGYFGVNLVLTLIQSSGALIAVTVTTCRKAITMVLSFLIFSKPFTSGYIWSGMIVLLGIYLNIYSKNRVKWNASFQGYLKSFSNRRGRLTRVGAGDSIV